MNRDLFKTITENNSIKFKRILKEDHPKGEGLINREAVYSLVNYETRVELFQGLPMTSLSLAHIITFYDSLECLLELYRVTDDLNVKSGSGISPIPYAIVGQSLECLQFLHSLGASLKENIMGKSPIYLATCTGNYRMVKFLIDRDVADPIFDNQGNNNPLVIAIEMQNYEIFELLLQNGYNIESEVGKSPLFQAVSLGLDQGIETLVRFGFNVNARTSTGEFPLMLALQLNKIETVKTLIRVGADLKLRGPQDITLCHICASIGNPNLLKMLLENGVDYNAIDEHGRTAIFYALNSLIDLSASMFVIKTLVKQGVNINKLDQSDNSVLSEALTSPRFCTVEFIKFLVSLGADPLLISPDHTRSIFSCVIEGDISVSGDIQQILKNAADQIQQKKLQKMAEIQNQNSSNSETKGFLSKLLSNRFKKLSKPE